MNLGIYLSRSARYWPQAPALVCGDRTWTFTGLDRSTDRLASALAARGLGPGDAVASLAWNRGELVEVEFALYKAGLTRAPINARLGRGEIEHILRYAPVRVLVYDAAHREDALAAIAAAGTECLPVCLDGAQPGEVSYADLLAEGHEAPFRVEVDQDASCVLNFTSGSTGALKAAVQTVGNRLANMRKQLMADESRPAPTPATSPAARSPTPPAWACWPECSAAPRHTSCPLGAHRASWRRSRGNASPPPSWFRPC